MLCELLEAPGFGPQGPQVQGCHQLGATPRLVLGVGTSTAWVLLCPLSSWILTQNPFGRASTPAPIGSIWGPRQDGQATSCSIPRFLFLINFGGRNGAQRGCELSLRRHFIHGWGIGVLASILSPGSTLGFLRFSEVSLLAWPRGGLSWGAGGPRRDAALLLAPLDVSSCLRCPLGCTQRQVLQAARLPPLLLLRHFLGPDPPEERPAPHQLQEFGRLPRGEPQGARGHGRGFPPR